MANDFSEELAVTKNDIKHLAEDIREIKEGIKEINENFTEHISHIDEKYVRKEDFKEHVQGVERRSKSLNAPNFSLIGSIFTGLILLIINLIMGHLK